MRKLSFVHVALVLSLGLFGLLTAQNKPAAPADYGQFETLGPAAPYGGLSPDGKWLAYAVNRSSRSNELRIANIADGTSKVVAFGAQPVFSSDSKWLAYTIGYSETQEDKFKKDKKRSEKKLGLLDLSTGEQKSVDGIESAVFSPTGSYLAMRRYAPEKKEPPEPGTAADESPAGATLIVRDLKTGRDTAFGNVSESAWQDPTSHGHLLALAIGTDDKTGNAVQLFNPETAALRVLDSSSSVYTSLAWRKGSSDLAVLRSQTNADREGLSQVVLSWSKLSEAAETAHLYDPAKDSSFPTGMRLVSYRKPTWADDGATVFLGIAKWEKKLPSAKDKAADKNSEKADDEPAAVDVWHWRDVEVMPRQKLSARIDRQKNMLAAWHIASGKFVPLAQSQTEQVTPLKNRNLAWEVDWTPYAMERSIGRPEANLSLVDLGTGARTNIKDKLFDDHYIQASPGGKYPLFFQNDQYWTVNTETRAMVNITKNAKASFVDRESDETIKQKPAFGVAGWTKDDDSVILYDKFDLWQLAPDGSRATRLTNGAAEQVRHRYVKLDPEAEFIDSAKPLYLSLFGIWTKQSGYSRLTIGSPEERLIWADKSVARLAKAKDAEVFAYATEKFDESPNIYIAGQNLTDPKRVSNTNPFQTNYAWGREQLIDYKNSHGEHLQGSLIYPAGYEPGKKYPMVVYLYEKLSDGLHRFGAPSERDYYSPGAISSHGYFLLMPDITFAPREPGISVADCVTAAVKKVLETGLIDANKIGVIGHSWGGFDTTFLATHTKLFAAAVAGAPITDLVSNYGNHHWSSGIAETDHIETGQQRMEVPLWEDLPAYIRNSAVFNVQNMTTPLMIEVGDSDGTVFFHQGVELYNVARRAKKNVVLLVYAGEDHGLRKKADQVDYQQRIFAWFGHYLKDEPAPAWITEGNSYLDRQRELSELKGKR